MTERQNPYNFKVGDKVKTRYRPEEAEVIRTLITLTEARETRYGGYETGSGYSAEADGGEVCPHCGRSATPILGDGYYQGIDLAWFRPSDHVYSRDDVY